MNKLHPDIKASSEELAYIEKEGIKIVSCNDNKYPKSLKEIYDPPSVLYYKGDLLESDINAVAIVGSRRCSLYGLQMAERLAGELAEKGITIISGMARGIDSAAHRGALKHGGRTIAVIGSGFRHIYPTGSEELMNSIIKNGAVITEFPSETLPLKHNFPRRNRIISGLSKGVLVVEAAKKSGALITARLALEQGRDVFAVPGRADFYTADGTNLLIQNGAKLVMRVEDILEELRLDEVVSTSRGSSLVTTFDDPREVETTKAHSKKLREIDKKILSLLEREHPVHINYLLEYSGVDNGHLSEILLRLEIGGLIKASFGRNYSLKGAN